MRQDRIRLLQMVVQMSLVAIIIWSVVGFINTVMFLLIMVLIDDWLDRTYGICLFHHWNYLAGCKFCCRCNKVDKKYSDKHIAMHNKALEENKADNLV